MMQLFFMFPLAVLITCDSDITKETLFSLKHQMHKLEAAFQLQNAEIHELKAENKELKGRMEDLATENNELKDYLRLQLRAHQKRDEVESIGFSATLSSDVALGDNQIIVFDNVVTNNGNGYDFRLGQFTAPVTGLYAFSVTAMCVESETVINVAIMRDSQVIGVAFANGYFF
ncbi:heavy metal-binding protein HIP-like [Argopecten irradians]|uniref:heavy metal-binding protein HIP-like n=1 Tax=Argopecten irradians TaxID=31199 RepID=UPI003719991F